MAAEPSEIQKLEIQMMCRLFWLLRTIPDVPRYPEDVKLFSDAEVLIGVRSEVSAEAIQGYDKATIHPIYKSYR